MSIIDVLSAIHPQDKVLVVFHGDADGCAAASLFCHFLESIGTSYALYTPENGDPRILPELVELAKGYDYTVVLDIAHRPREVYEQLAHASKVVVIDHHVDREPFDVPGVAYANPTSEGRKAPVAQLVYEAINELGEFDRLCWIALLGVAGDKEQERFPKLVAETFSRYPNLQGGASYGDLAIVRYLVGIISCGRAYAKGKGAKLVVEALVEAGRHESPEMLVSGMGDSAELIGYRLHTNRVVRNLVDLHVEHSTLVPERGLLFYPIESPLYIQNYVAGIIRARRPEWVCAVANTGLGGDAALVELRTGRGGLDLSGIAIEACQGILGSDAGGHPEAAHATVPAASLGAFRERLEAALPLLAAPPSDVDAPQWRRGRRPQRAGGGSPQPEQAKATDAEEGPLAEGDAPAEED